MTVVKSQYHVLKITDFAGVWYRGTNGLPSKSLVTLFDT